MGLLITMDIFTSARTWWSPAPCSNRCPRAGGRPQRPRALRWRHVAGIRPALRSCPPTASRRISTSTERPRRLPAAWFSSDEVVAGTPDEVARNLIDQCERTGAGHVLIYGGWPLSRPVFKHTVELYGRDVLPRLLNRSLPRGDTAERE